LNEGDCIDEIDGYSCFCESGWNGTHCEYNVDECLRSVKGQGLLDR